MEFRQSLNPGRETFAVALLLLLAMVAVMLSAGNDFPALHSILDTAVFMVSGLLAFLLWDLGWRTAESLPRLEAVCFAAVGTLELLHVITALDFAEAPDAAMLLRLGTWSPQRARFPGPVTGFTGIYRPTGPLLILIGEKDDWTPAEPCRWLAETAQAQGYPVEITVYPGAHHSFDSTAPLRYVPGRNNPNGFGWRANFNYATNRNRVVNLGGAARIDADLITTDYNLPGTFIEVGKPVKAGETLLIIEAMKVMNPITAPAGGVVKKVLISDGQPVEFDQPLVIIG